jgi:hypothetical protein
MVSLHVDKILDLYCIRPKMFSLKSDNLCFFVDIENKTTMQFHKINSQESIGSRNHTDFHIFSISINDDCTQTEFLQDLIT